MLENVGQALSTGDFTVQVGKEGTVMLGAIGLGVGAGGAMDSSGNACVYGKLCVPVGVGFFAGGGNSLQVQTGRASTGFEDDYSPFVNISGEGLAGGLQLSVTAQGNIAGGKAWGGGGFGYGAGVNGCRTFSLCTDIILQNGAQAR